MIGPRYKLVEALSTYKAKQVISIFEAAEVGKEGEPTPEGVTHHVRYYFDDTVNSDTWRVPPTRRDVEEIINQYYKLNKEEPIFIHCFAGISRSSATAYILNAIHLGEGNELQAIKLTEKQALTKGIAPNKLLVALADDLLKRNGNMIIALKQWEDDRFKSIDDLVKHGYIIENDEI